MKVGGKILVWILSISFLFYLLIRIPEPDASNDDLTVEEDSNSKIVEKEFPEKSSLERTAAIFALNYTVKDYLVENFKNVKIPGLIELYDLTKTGKVRSEYMENNSNPSVPKGWYYCKTDAWFTSNDQKIYFIAYSSVNMNTGESLLLEFALK